MLGLNVSLGLVGVIAAGVELAAILIIEDWDLPKQKFFTDFGAMMIGSSAAYVFPFIRAVASDFEAMGQTPTSIWQAVSAAFVGFWNGLITFSNAAINSLVKGIEGLANEFITVVNSMISAYNSVASLLRLGSIGKIPAITLPTISILL